MIRTTTKTAVLYSQQFVFQTKNQRHKSTNAKKTRMISHGKTTDFFLRYAELKLNVNHQKLKPTLHCNLSK